VRFHPLINNYELLQDDFEIIQLGETAALDLSNEDTIWNNIQPRMKSKIRKTMKSSVEITISLMMRCMIVYLKILNIM